MENLLVSLIVFVIGFVFASLCESNQGIKKEGKMPIIFKFFYQEPESW